MFTIPIRSSSRSVARKAWAVAALPRALLAEAVAPEGRWLAQTAENHSGAFGAGGAAYLAAAALPSEFAFPPLAAAFLAAGIFEAFDPFGGGGPPEIPWYDTTHKSRGAHEVYCRVQGICGAIVTQQGNIILAQSAEDPEDGGGDEGDAIAREGDAISQIEQYEQQEKTLDAMGRPPYAYDDRGFLAWLRQMEHAEAPAVTAAQANAITHEARRLGLEVRLDSQGHDTPGNPWTRPHLNVMGHTANVHVFVPNDYKLP